MIAALLLVVSVAAAQDIPAPELSFPQGLLDTIRAKAKALAFREGVSALHWNPAGPLGDKDILSLQIRSGVPADRIAGLQSRVGLQGDTGTCTRYAIAAALTVQGLETSGLQVRQAAYSLDLDWTAELRAQEARLDAQLSRGDGPELAAPGQAELLAAVEETVRQRPGQIDDLGMPPNDPDMANVLGYGVKGIRGSELTFAAFRAAWQGTGSPEEFYRYSAAVRSRIANMLSQGAPALAVITVGKLGKEDGGLHAVAVLARTRDGRAVVYDSNLGVVAVDWDSLMPLWAFRIRPK